MTIKTCGKDAATFKSSSRRASTPGPGMPHGVAELRLEDLERVVGGRALILDSNGQVNLFRVAAR